MKYAFVCDTPYQLLSIISYVSTYRDDVEYSDVFVEILRSNNVDMHKLCVNIQKMGLFNHVYEMERMVYKHKKLAPVYKIYEWLFPKESFVKSVKNSKKMVYNDWEYDVVGMTGPFPLIRNIKSLAVDSKVIFLEDGAGSYSGKIGIELSGRGRFVQKLLKRGPKYINPEACYLYKPELYKGEYESIVKKMIFPLEKMSQLKKVFDIKDTSIELFKKNNVIYLGQTEFLSEKNNNSEKKIIEILREKVPGMVVRAHPAQDKAIYKGCNIDYEMNQWELICGDAITDNHVLIGKYSTAQIIPKLLYDKEPTLIFTYKMYGINEKFVYDGIESIREIYKDKNKIVCVNNNKEIIQALSKVDYC